MTLQPESQDTIFDRIKTAVASASAINNFSETSPERALSDDGFAAEQRERQHELLALQLSARIGYAGRGTDDSEEPIGAEDLEDLGLDPADVDLELLNSYLEQADLDALVARNSVERDPGDFATGQVTFTTASDSVVIPAGTEVTTEPDSDGDVLAFTTDSEVTPSTNSTTVTADVTAAERGTDHNVGSGTITRLPSPPPGVSSVTNNNATTGGEAAETNAELRSRAKDAILNNSGGGTLDGVEGGLVAAFDGLDLADVIVDEFPNETPPNADVIVDGGGTDQTVQDEIDALRPVAITHTLVRPTDITLDVSADVTGTDVDASAVESDVQDYLNALGIGADMVRDQLVATIMTADLDVTGIDQLTVTLIDETHTYDSDNSGGDAPNHPLYKLEKGDSMASDGITEVTGTLSSSSHTFTEGTDYEEGVVDGSDDDAIDWGVGGDDPDEDTDFDVDYEIADDCPIDSREKAVPGTVSVTVV